MSKEEKPPVRIDARSATPDNAATFIFLHGLGDDGDSWTGT